MKKRAAKKAVAAKVTKENKTKIAPKKAESNTANDEKKLFSIKDVSNTTRDAFWIIRDKYELRDESKYNAAEVLDLLIADAQNKSVVNADEWIIKRSHHSELLSEIDTLKNENNELKISNETLTKKVEQFEDIATSKFAELQDEVQQHLSTIETLTEQLDNVKSNAIFLKDGEFICKLRPDVIEAAGKLKAFLEKNVLKNISSDTSFSEELANYCIKELLEFRYSHIINKQP